MQNSTLSPRLIPNLQGGKQKTICTKKLASLSTVTVKLGNQIQGHVPVALLTRCEMWNLSFDSGPRLRWNVR